MVSRGGEHLRASNKEHSLWSIALGAMASGALCQVALALDSRLAMRDLRLPAKRLFCALMALMSLIALIAIVAAGGRRNTVSGDDALLLPQEKHLRNIRQLTDGGENAEAYFSADGKQLIFQSTRDGHQCDQVYVMNTDGSDV